MYFNIKQALAFNNKDADAKYSCGDAAPYEGENICNKYKRLEFLFIRI
jgi:hypothetical protein